jgi:hypothetical protein
MAEKDHPALRILQAAGPFISREKHASTDNLASLIRARDYFHTELVHNESVMEEIKKYAWFVVARQCSLSSLAACCAVVLSPCTHVRLLSFELMIFSLELSPSLA